VDAISAEMFTLSVSRHLRVPGTPLHRQLRYAAAREGIGRKQDIPSETELELSTFLLLNSRGLGVSVYEVGTLA
jgi:hypothetical protein